LIKNIIGSKNKGNYKKTNVRVWNGEKNCLNQYIECHVIDSRVDSVKKRTKEMIVGICRVQ